jgi:hypothetical protein
MTADRSTIESEGLISQILDVEANRCRADIGRLTAEIADRARQLADRQDWLNTYEELSRAWTEFRLERTAVARAPIEGGDR